jgi:hypothetical protein
VRLSHPGDLPTISVIETPGSFVLLIGIEHNSGQASHFQLVERGFHEQLSSAVAQVIWIDKDRVNDSKRAVITEPFDLLVRTRAWQNADISDNSLYNGDLNAALKGITARAVVMPSSTDQYFWSDDSKDEVGAMTNAKFKEIPSIWGHVAPTGRDAAATRFIDDSIRELIG